MTNTKDIIIKLKEIREEKGYSYSDIQNIMKDKGIYPVSTSTLSRVFSENSEEFSFNYENTIRPIAETLLDIEEIKDDDDMDVQAMKSLLKYKIARIEELENQNKNLKTELLESKNKYHDKLDKEREQFKRSLDFLKHQIELKDDRITQLLHDNSKFTDHIMNCPYREKQL